MFFSVYLLSFHFLSSSLGVDREREILEKGLDGFDHALELLDESNAKAERLARDLDELRQLAHEEILDQEPEEDSFSESLREILSAKENLTELKVFKTWELLLLDVEFLRFLMEAYLKAPSPENLGPEDQETQNEDASPAGISVGGFRLPRTALGEATVFLLTSPPIRVPVSNVVISPELRSLIESWGFVRIEESWIQFNDRAKFSSQFQSIRSALVPRATELIRNAPEALQSRVSGLVQWAESIRVQDAESEFRVYSRPTVSTDDE